jgi:molecular chaperone HtpG
MMDRTLEKLLARQKDSGVSVSAPILEINAGHPLIKGLASTVAAKGAGEIADAAQLLLDQAFILEGEPVADPASFAKRLDQMMVRVFA